MTGINASKIIQNLEFVNSFAPYHCSRARCSVLEVSRQSRHFEYFRSLCFCPHFNPQRNTEIFFCCECRKIAEKEKIFFVFRYLGPVHTPYHLRRRGQPPSRVAWLPSMGP